MTPCNQQNDFREIIQMWRIGYSGYSASVHKYPDVFESATFSFRIRLPSTRIGRIRQRIRSFLNPLARVGKNKSSMNPITDNMWTGKSGYFRIRWRNKFVSRLLLNNNSNNRALYSAANDPRPQMIPRPEIIPKLNRKWSRTANDPRCGPLMIPSENEEWHGVWFPGLSIFYFLLLYLFILSSTKRWIR